MTHDEYDRITKEELAEMRRIQKKIEESVGWSAYKCHGNSNYCTKCGEGCFG